MKLPIQQTRAQKLFKTTHDQNENLKPNNRHNDTNNKANNQSKALN